MKKPEFLTLFLITLVIVAGYFLTEDYFRARSFSQEREEIVSEIDNFLTEATLSGDYKCCIVPPCKMCFFGNWIWNDGRCDCDTEMARGNWDNVCPECMRGVEEGRCKSETKGTCPID